MIFDQEKVKWMRVFLKKFVRISRTERNNVYTVGQIHSLNDI